ncbi:MAG: AAA family ATPase [Paludibacteraceae bacterium]|nr:AAA family ATPase [Paludibacteraceae bacterium]
MTLQNFKGVQQATYQFRDVTSITGGNATGKSTIYEAYLWCLFDKNQMGNATKVQPLDENNEVKHKLVTSVVLEFLIDRIPFIVERSLQEKWVKPRGTTELICQGTTSEYAINEVPMTKGQFEAKLAEIMPLEKWFMISSINIIPSLDQKACRAALQAIAPAIDDKAIAHPYPYVYKGLQDGFSIEEMSAVVKQGKQKAKTELDTIPAALDAQDRLRVDDDFVAVENELAEVNNAIAERQKAIEEANKVQVDKAEIEKANELRTRLSAVQKQIAEIEDGAIAEIRKRNGEVAEQLSKYQTEANAINQRINIYKGSARTFLCDIEAYAVKMAQLRKQWIDKNGEEYQEPAIATTCPTCGQPLPAERVEAARSKAKEEWNACKKAELDRIQKEAESTKARIDDIKKQNEDNEQNLQSDQTLLNDLIAKIEMCNKEHEAMPDYKDLLAENEEYKNALKVKVEIEESIAAKADNIKKDLSDIAAEVNTIKTEIAALGAKRYELTKRLAGREANHRIDVERMRLEGRQAELADLIAKYEGQEAQIAAYRKDKITAVENGVSSLFTMVRWKMYEANVTNDGEKEICQAIIDGVPFEQQNRATQVNAAIDIVNAFAKAYDVSAPLFIDNAESVSSIILTNGQIITLTVVAGAPLNVE